MRARRLKFWIPSEEEGFCPWCAFDLHLASAYYTREPRDGKGLVWCSRECVHERRPRHVDVYGPRGRVYIRMLDDPKKTYLCWDTGYGMVDRRHLSQPGWYVVPVR